MVPIILLAVGVLAMGPPPQYSKGVDPFALARTIKERERAARQRAPAPLVDEIRGYVDAASAAYCLSRGNPLPGFELKHVVHPGKHATARVFTRGSDIVVSFRGYKSCWDLKHRYDVPYSLRGGVVVSRDVLVFATSLRQDLVGAVARVYSRNRASRLVLVGHSLGGAIATFMGPILAARLGVPSPRMRIVTYNQPRVGNQAFAKLYNSHRFNFTRVVNKDDPTANFPSNGDWAHVQREVYIDEDENFSLCSDAALEDPICSFGRTNELAYLYRHNRIADLHIGYRDDICGP